VETCRGVEIQLHEFLISALGSGDWSASRPGCFTAWERAPVPNGYEAAWNPELVWTRWRRENVSHYRESKSGLPVRSPNATLTELPRPATTLALTCKLHATVSSGEMGLPRRTGARYESELLNQRFNDGRWKMKRKDT
jgi:hypothetical protein